MQDGLVRAVRPDEWKLLRDLRLEALRDDASRVAFLESFDDVAIQPDGLWQARALAGSEFADGDVTQ